LLRANRGRPSGRFSLAIACHGRLWSGGGRAQSTLGDSTIGMLQFNAIQSPVVVLIRIAPAFALGWPRPIDGRA